MTPAAVLCFSGLDPSGGAGIQADIQTLTMLGCHPCPIISCITVQDSVNVYRVEATSADFVLQQFQTLLQSMPIHVVKVGLLPSIELIECLHQILQTHPRLKVILDPIIFAGGGAQLIKNQVKQKLIDLILPHSCLITPNLSEAMGLSNINQDTKYMAHALMDLGCDQVLITDTQNHPKQIDLELWHPDSCTSYQCPRLPNDYHGSGCTLSSAISGFLSQHKTTDEAVQAAVNFTFDCLNNGYQLDKGQHFPNRGLGNMIRS